MYYKIIGKSQDNKWIYVMKGVYMYIADCNIYVTLNRHI